MLCYKDKTFCLSSCCNNKCDRNYNTIKFDTTDAKNWSKSLGADFPISLADFSSNCKDFIIEIDSSKAK